MYTTFRDHNFKYGATRLIWRNHSRKGAYNHCLQEYWDDYNADWRMQYNINNRGDVYPTHGMGPACQLLNIHRGDRMKYLVAMDSNPFSLPEYLKEHGKGTEAQKLQNGEITLTLIRTEKGKQSK